MPNQAEPLMNVYDKEYRFHGLNSGKSLKYTAKTISDNSKLGKGEKSGSQLSHYII